MDLLKLGTQILMQQLGGGAQAQSEGAVQSALGSLIGNGESMDLAGLVEKAQQGGLGDLASSWLGDGANAQLTAEQAQSMVDDGDLGNLASALGTDKSSVLNGLKDVLPQLVDKGSSGGSLLDSIGGLEGAASLAKKFF
ncbi:MAG: YidB family protein [Pseudomonadota bacterium]